MNKKYNKINSNKLCRCGCGELTKFSYMNKGFNDYVNGHNRRNIKPWNRHTLQEDSKKLTPELSYVVGVYYGDGNIYCSKDSCYSISLGAIDKEFVSFFKSQIEKWSKIKCQKILKISNEIYKKGYYIVKLSSIEVIYFIKSITFNKIKKAPKECKIAFLKGMYDSEGTIHKEKHFISISNQNKPLLQLCKILLLDLGIESRLPRLNTKKGTKRKFPNGKVYACRKDCYEFMICGRKNLIKFNNLIGFTIERKQRVLDNKLNSYISKEEKDYMLSLPFQKRPMWKELYETQKRRDEK